MRLSVMMGADAAGRGVGAACVEKEKAHHQLILEGRGCSLYLTQQIAVGKDAEKHVLYF